MKTLYEFAETLLNESVSPFLMTLNKIYQKTEGKDYPKPNATEEELRTAVFDIASKHGFKEKPNTSWIVNSNNANNFLHDKISTLTKNDAPEKETSVEDKTKQQSQDSSTPQDISPKKFPSYSEFRKKYYKATVDLGWPKNVKYPDVNDNASEGGIEYPWNPILRTAYVFNKRGKGLVSLKNYTKKIKDYLYTKFKDDIPGLEKLLAKVESILDVESHFLPRSKASIMGSLLMSVFRGLGANSTDEAILKWIGSKFQGMTIFQYQKMILEEMLVKMSITDSTSSTLKNILNPLFLNVKKECSKYFNIGQVSLNHDSYENLFIAYFEVKTKTGDKVLSKTQAPYYYVLENIVLPMMKGEGYKSKSGKNLDFDMTIKDIESYIKQLKETDDKHVKEVVDSYKEPIEFTYDAVDPNKGNVVVGKYFIKFEYITKGCRISVMFQPKRKK